MKEISFGKHKFSQLILGTVQLGMEYGISNVLGQPSLDQSIDMIKSACDHGVNTLDTAREYGSAESVIAHALPSESKERPCHIISKFRINPQHESDLEKSWSEVLSIVQESLRILNREKITGVLFHRNPKNDLEAFIKVLPTLIMRLKEMDLIEYGGLSAHYPDDVRYAIGEDQLEIIQVPTNIFDHRLLKIAPNGELDDKLVVARSIFLQGLFFLDPDKLTGALAGARQPLIRLREICRDHDLSIGQLSVAFVRDLPQVDCLVIGALTPAQIAENVSLVEQPSISDQLRKEILNIFSDIDHLIITPALWPN